MMIVSPYINFQGRARAAMEFYHGVLGGSVELLATDQEGKAREAAPGDRIAHARLRFDGGAIVGSDGHPDYPATVGNNLAVALRGNDRARLSRLFAALADGGRIQMPFGEAGWVVDRFGVTWLVELARA